jgi:hypothetical protein
MQVNTHNDWDPLEEIIVGRADGARVNTDISSHSFNFSTLTAQQVQQLGGALPQWLIDEANADIDGLADTLSKLGVRVHRPLPIDQEQEFKTPDWQSPGNSVWCPRDLILPLGDWLIETPSPVRGRYWETRAYESILYEAFEDGAVWISAPKPRLLDTLYDISGDVRGRSTLLNHEICFDAPNIVRVGRDLLYQISNSGNLKGFQWLKRLLEPRGYRLHYSELYSYAHFDSTILPLRPGLVLLNSGRVTPENCPEIFRKWDKIWFQDCVAQPIGLGDFHPPCSTYIGMNILSVDTHTIICDDQQVPLMRELSRHGIDTIGIPFRHAQVLSGGMHCVTLDLRRRGTLEDYT